MSVLIVTEINTSDEEAKLNGLKRYQTIYKCRSTGKVGAILVIYRRKKGARLLTLQYQLNIISPLTICLHIYNTIAI